MIYTELCKKPFLREKRQITQQVLKSVEFQFYIFGGLTVNVYSVMVCGCIWVSGVGDLVKINGIMNLEMFKYHLESIWLAIALFFSMKMIPNTQDLKDFFFFKL